VCFLAHSIGTQVKATNDGECYELIPLVLGLVRCGLSRAGPGAAQTVKGPGAACLESAGPGVNKTHSQIIDNGQITPT